MADKPNKHKQPAPSFSFDSSILIALESSNVRPSARQRSRPRLGESVSKVTLSAPSSATTTPHRRGYQCESLLRLVAGWASIVSNSRWQEPTFSSVSFSLKYTIQRWFKKGLIRWNGDEHLIHLTGCLCSAIYEYRLSSIPCRVLTKGQDLSKNPSLQQVEKYRVKHQPRGHRTSRQAPGSKPYCSFLGLTFKGHRARVLITANLPTCSPPPLTSSTHDPVRKDRSC